MQQPANFFQHALANRRTVELYGGCGHNTHEELRARLALDTDGSMPPFLCAWGPLASSKLPPSSGEKPALGALLSSLGRRKTFRQQRGGKVHAGKIRAGQVRLAQNRHAHVRAGEFCPIHVGKTQIYIAKMRPLEIYVRKV